MSASSCAPLLGDVDGHRTADRRGRLAPGADRTADRIGRCLVQCLRIGAGDAVGAADPLEVGGVGGAGGGEQAGVEPQVDDRHGQRLGAVDDGPVAGLAPGVGGELGGVDRHVRRRDGDHRVDRRDDVGDVAHVGGADDRGAGAGRVDRVPAGALGVGGVGGDDGPVVEHVGVGGVVPRDLAGAPGGGGAGFEAGRAPAASRPPASASVGDRTYQWAWA